MIKISILKGEAQTLKGIGKTSGKPYELAIQTGYAHVIDADGVVAEIPEKFEFILGKGPDGHPLPPLPRGQYSLAASSFYVDRDGRLALNPVFVPVAKEAK